MMQPFVVREISVDLDPSVFRAEFVLQLSELTAAENELWRQRLRAFASDCGCTMGARFCAAFTVGLPFALWAAWRTHQFTTSGLIITSVVGLTVVAGLGKAIGMAVARMRLLGALKRLRRRCHA